MEVIKRDSTGNDVKILQSTLNRIGYGPISIDGEFKDKTEEEVIDFQKSEGINPDGIVGESTWAALRPFLTGYDEYIIQPNDTFWKVAEMFNTDVKSILVANPDLDPNKLVVGQKIIVPYGIEVVPTDVGYTYEILNLNIEGLKKRYPFIDIEIIGKSTLGRNIYALKIGKGDHKVIYNAAHHSLEWITSPLLMKYAENFLDAYVYDKKIDGYNVRDIYDKSTIYIVPMVNPDGIELVINGLKKNNPNYLELIKWNDDSTDFSRTWQANNEGVDLNHNYNAGWEQYQQLQKELDITGPGPTKYSGPRPESEPESRALAEFTRKIKPRLTLAYHSQGEIIYWQFEDMATMEAKRIGEILAKVSDYKLDQTQGTASYTGYKDWFIKEYRKPGYTVEVGKGKNPLPISQFPKIYEDNKELLTLAAVI